MKSPSGVKALRVQGRIRSETTRREKTNVDRRKLCNRIQIRQEKMTTRLRQGGCLAWISICLEDFEVETRTLEERLNQQRMKLPHYNLRQPSWMQNENCWRAVLLAIPELSKRNFNGVSEEKKDRRHCQSTFLGNFTRRGVGSSPQRQRE